MAGVREQGTIGDGNLQSSVEKVGRAQAAKKKDWGVLADSLYKGITGYLTEQENFKQLLAVYFSQVGVKDRSDVGQLRHDANTDDRQGTTFHECFFATVDASDAQFCQLAGSTQDLKLLEIAQAAFALGVQQASYHDYHWFDSVAYATRSLDAWINSTNVGLQDRETQWLLADVWIEKYIRAITSIKFLNWKPEKWASGLKTLWAVYEDSKGKCRSDWLSVGSFQGTNDDQMAMMIAMTKYFCNDLPTRGGEGSTAAYVGSQLMGARTGEEESEEAPAGQLFITDCALRHHGPCVVEVDSDRIDLGFKFDVWRPQGQAGEYVHVFRLDMPLVKGRNRRVIHAADGCSKGDVIGWWSEGTPRIQYRKEASMSTRSMHFSPKGGKWEHVAVNCAGSAPSTGKTYAIRVLEESATWLKMQRAVRDEYPDLCERYLSLANRTHFLDKSSVSGLRDEWGPFLQTQKVITGAPILPDQPLPVATYSYRDLIKTKSTHVDFIQAGDKYQVCIQMDPRTMGCRTKVWKQMNTYACGFNVRHWLDANRDTLLKDTVLGAWKNTYQKEEYADKALQVASSAKDRAMAKAMFWETLSKQGSKIQYEFFLDDSEKAWGLLTLNPHEPEGSKSRVRLESVDPARCFKVPSFQPAKVTKDEDLELSVQAGISSCSGIGGFRGKNFLQGDFATDFHSMEGTLITGVDFEDRNPIKFSGRRVTRTATAGANVATAGLFGCCAAAAAAADGDEASRELTVSAARMSVKELCRLTPANQGEVHTNVMRDISDAALALYPQKWVDVLNMQDAVRGKKVPAHMEELVKDEEVKAVLQDVVTAQIAPQLWSASLAPKWAPVGKTQQDIKDRAHYYLQGLDKTTLAASPAFSEVFQRVKSHHVGKLTPGLPRYVDGEGGKSAVEWAHALHDHFAHDMENAFALLLSDPQDGVLSKAFDVVSSLTAGSSHKAHRELPDRFVRCMNVALFHYCRQIVGALPGGVDDMQDVIGRSMGELKRTSEDRTVNDGVREGIKDAFKSLPVAEQDFARSLAKFFTDKVRELPSFSDRLAAWTEKLKADYPKMATKDFNRVSNFSAYTMLSVSSSIAYFSITTKSDLAWKDYDAKDCIQLGVGLSVQVLSALAKKGTQSGGVLESRAAVDSVREALEQFAWLQVEQPTAASPIGSFYAAGEVSYYAVPTQQISDGEMYRLLDQIGNLSSDSSIEPAVFAAESGQTFGKRCLTWVAGTRASAACACVTSFLACATAVLELYLMKNLSNLEKNLLRADAIISGASVVLNAGRALFLADSATGIIEASAWGVAFGAFGWALLAAAVVIEVVFFIVHATSHDTVGDFVDEMGVRVLQPVNKPSKEWLRDHALPDSGEQRARIR